MSYTRPTPRYHVKNDSDELHIYEHMFKQQADCNLDVFSNTAVLVYTDKTSWDCPCPGRPIYRYNSGIPKMYLLSKVRLL